MNREPTDKELSGGVICDGLGSTFAALFGVLPNTSFSQNVGLVAMTKVVNRMALASGAVFLILCGLIPKLGALISIMPQAVLGGAAVMMFSSIVVSGIQLITKEQMTPRQLTIVSVALGVGYGMGANSGILANTPHAFQLICGERSGRVNLIPFPGQALPAAPVRRAYRCQPALPAVRYRRYAPASGTCAAGRCRPCPPAG